MNDLARLALSIAKDIQDDVPKRGRPPDQGMEAESHQVIPESYVRSTRGYIEKIANQINGTYERGWFDGCAVMMRRLLETLIIEAFENNGKASLIQNAAGDYLSLDALVGKVIAEFRLGRTSKRALPDIVELGNQSAHSRRFTADHGDIARHIGAFRHVVQELLTVANLR